jgi:hypothetical protein
VIDLATKKQSRLAPGFYRAQWAGDGKSVVSNGFFVHENEDDLRSGPVRFRLDKPYRPEPFHADLDNPWSPCVSRNGKTVVVVVDSKERKPSSATTYAGEKK